jgi:hypothetical protein
MIFPNSYYSNLITHQYQSDTKMLAFLDAMLQKYADIEACNETMDYWFDVDNAVGVQLDTVGQNNGVALTLGFQPSGGVSPILDDDTYRILIKAKIAQDHWDGRRASLNTIWSGLFPGGSVVLHDNQNMTATVTLYGAFSSIIQDLIVNGLIVPRPQAVLYTYIYGTMPFFGADLNNSFIAGSDLGHVTA